MLKDQAAGTSSFCISPSPPSHYFSQWLLPKVPHCKHHRHSGLVCTHIPHILLLAETENTSLDFETILHKTLPGMTCRGPSSHHFHSVQQFRFKPSRFGKAKGCTGKLVEQGGKLPCACSVFLDVAIQLFLFS